MANQVPIECLQSVRDKQHDLFLHYSLIRMAILAFLIPFGGMFIIQNQGQPMAGGLLIGVAVLLNWIFGAWSLNAHVLYEHYHEHLKSQPSGAISCAEPEHVDIRLPYSYARVTFGCPPIECSGLSEGWRVREPIIQLFVFGIIGAFLGFVLCCKIGLIAAGAGVLILFLCLGVSWIIIKIKKLLKKRQS